jgi:lipopolysaccharide export system protein LptC
VIVPKQRLQSLNNAEESRLRAWGAGYTWFVKTLRLALPVGALIIVGIVVARLSVDPEQQNIADVPASAETSAGQIALEGAKYEGVDAQGRAYTLTADAASRDPKLPDSLTLTRPKADISLTEDSWLAVESQSGLYDNAAKKLILSEGVKVFHDSGNEMHFQDVTIDLATNDATTAHAVSAQGPLGTLSAGGMTVSEQGNKILFTGPVAMKLYLGGRG